MAKWVILSLITTFVISILNTQVNSSPATKQVDLIKKTTDQLKPIWSWLGYDEPNYTYIKDGKKLLSEFAALNLQPFFVRAHHLLVTGGGTASLECDSTNAFTEDANSNPNYNWKIVDSIFDIYLQQGMKPFTQIGFMPEVLSVNPQSDRVPVVSDSVLNNMSIRDSNVCKSDPDVRGIAANNHSDSVMIWNYHNKNDLNIPASPVTVSVEEIPSQKILLTHCRIDQEHSNSFTAEKKMRSPQNPTEEQIAALGKAGQLEMPGSPQCVTIKNGATTIDFDLPRQRVSLIKIKNV